MSNFTVLQELREFKDEEKFREFMQEAHVQLKQNGALLMTEMSRANWAAAQRLAHRLKGTMGSLGCENLHDVLQSRLSGDTSCGTHACRLGCPRGGTAIDACGVEGTVVPKVGFWVARIHPPLDNNRSTAMAIGSRQSPRRVCQTMRRLGYQGVSHRPHRQRQSDASGARFKRRVGQSNDPAR